MLAGIDLLSDSNPKAIMQKKVTNVQHRLHNNDDGRHKWRHIWLRAEHSSLESLRRSLIHEEHVNLGVEQGELDDADICPGVVSPLLVNARAPEDDSNYGRWGPTALIAALKGRKFENVMALLQMECKSFHHQTEMGLMDSFGHVKLCEEARD